MLTVSASGHTVTYDKDPSLCPVCHHAVVPTKLSSTLTGRLNSGTTLLENSFQCTNRDCGHAFIARYRQAGINTQKFAFTISVPVEHKPPEVSDEIKELSPGFVKIFIQSSFAEAHGLDEIAGGGYRKALEFLVKDYCIKNAPDKAEEIKAKFLGKVINDYIDDQNIKKCAQMAAWLGNDETHYVRKWEEKDINDLKILIELTTGWVRNNILTERYLAEMA